MSLGELGCPSLEYFYNMTWAEFRIRLFAYQRVEKRDWYKVREIAYASLIGPHCDPKKLPKTKESFMPMNEKSGVSKSMIEQMKKAQAQYLKDKQNG